MAKPGKIDSIQVLRGVAATLVAAFHLNAAGVKNTDYEGLFTFFRHGETGVDIFFVISGFIIYFTASAKADQTVRGFLVARFWRILPPYWAILSLYLGLAVALWLALDDSTRLPGLASLIVSVFVLPYPAHVIIIAWTLAIELLFYAVFALTFFRFGKGAFFAAMAIWVVVAQIYVAQDAFRSAVLSISLHTAVLEFLFGALIAEAHLRGVSRLQPMAFALGVALLIAHLLDVPSDFQISFGRELAAGVPSALIVYGALRWRWSAPDVLVLWGEASYILYLIHLLLFSIMGRAAAMMFGVQVYGSTASMLAMLAVAIVASCLATAYLERPYQRWYRRFPHR